MNRTICTGSVNSTELEELDEATILSLILCRLSELRRAGCDGASCLVLAGRTDIDLGRATQLLGRGCPADLALRILV